MELTIDQAIAYAWQDVQAARAALRHSPNATTRANVDIYEAAMNGLLDARPKLQPANA